MRHEHILLINTFVFTLCHSYIYGKYPFRVILYSLNSPLSLVRVISSFYWFSKMGIKLNYKIYCRRKYLDAKHTKLFKGF